jgi:hypothetical protein
LQLPTEEALVELLRFGRIAGIEFDMYEWIRHVVIPLGRVGRSDGERSPVDFE